MRSVTGFTAMAAIALLGHGAQAQDIRFFTNFDANAVSNWEPVLEAYQEQNPDSNVELETVAGSGAAIYPDVLRTSMAAGDPPDVFFMWGGEIAGPFIDAGQVMDLAPYYEQYGWEETLTPWTVEAITRNGKVYGVPFNARGMGFFYRTDIFEEHGIEVPTTYEEVENVCRTLKEAGVHCATFGGKFGWHPMRLLDYFLETRCGPELHDELNRLEASWDQPCVVESYTMLKTWVDEDWLMPDFLNISPVDARMPLYLGEAAMIIEGDWFESVARGDGMTTENLDFFVPPTGHEPVRYSAFPQQWMIPAGAENPDASAEFIDFIISPEVQNEFPEPFVASATVGVTPDCEEWPLTCKWREVITSQRAIYPPTDQAFTKELMDSFFEVQAGVISGQTPPKDAAVLMQERAEEWKASKT